MKIQTSKISKMSVTLMLLVMGFSVGSASGRTAEDLQARSDELLSKKQALGIPVTPEEIQVEKLRIQEIVKRQNANEIEQACLALEMDIVNANQASETTAWSKSVLRRLQNKDAQFEKDHLKRLSSSGLQLNDVLPQESYATEIQRMQGRMQALMDSISKNAVLRDEEDARLKDQEQALLNMVEISEQHNLTFNMDGTIEIQDVPIAELEIYIRRIKEDKERIQKQLEDAYVREQARMESEARGATNPRINKQPKQNTEVVLTIEDEEVVCHIVKKQLRKAGKRNGRENTDMFEFKPEDWKTFNKLLNREGALKQRLQSCGEINKTTETFTASKTVLGSYLNN